MITAPAKYTAAATPQHIVADWLLELAYDDTTPGTFYLSSQDRTITNFYAGNVLEWGDIEESIDLANSSASTSDITIVLANTWNNVDDSLAEELFGGTKKFINQNVTIKSWLLGCAETSDCLTIYVGRLVDIQHDFETITLVIEKRSPWDRVKISPVKSTVKSIGFPEVYGNYSRNDSGTFSTGKAVYPCPINDISGESLVALLADIVYSFPSSIPFLHYYDKSLDAFFYVANVASWYSNAIDYQGGKAAYVDQTLSRDFWHRPTNLTERTQDLSDAASAIDTDDTTPAIKTYSPTSTSGNFFYLYIEPPKVTGKITGIKLTVKYNLKSGEGLSSGTVAVSIYDVSYGLADPERNLVATLTVINTSSSGTASVDWFNADNYSAGDRMPENIILQAVLDSPTGYLDQGQVWIYDVYLDVQTAVDLTDEQSASNELNAIEQLYCGNDGYDNEWTDGSGVASYPLDIYRDMLNRYAGWDATGEDYVEVNGVDWSTWADSGRDWACLWWALEQKPLLPVLVQLQFEGAFIWIFDGTSSGVEARVIYVKSSYAAGDINKTLDGEYLDAKVSLSPLSEIVTKRTFNYQRHPAEKRYSLDTYKINGNRGDWNLETEENAIEQDLDFLTVKADADDLLTYYDNIVGEPKIIAVAELLDPSTWNLQVGDIVKFSNMEYEPYGKAWTDMYFMIVKVEIGVDKYIMTAREVG